MLGEEILNVFKVDPQYMENEEKYTVTSIYFNLYSQLEHHLLFKQPGKIETKSLFRL